MQNLFQSTQILFVFTKSLPSQTVLTSAYDFFPKAKRYGQYHCLYHHHHHGHYLADDQLLLRRYKSWLVFLLCSSCFLMSLPCVSYSGSIRTQQEQIKASSKSIFVSGAFVFQIMDDYGGGMSVMWIAIFEMFFIMWIHGSQNFARVSTFI